MTPQLKNLLIMLGAIAVILIIVILLFSGKSSFRRLLSVFLEEEGENSNNFSYKGAPTRGRPAAEPVQKSKSEPTVVMATLIRKSDDRLRIIESTGRERIEDEYYELVFVTRKGHKLKIECSPQAYERVPFNQQGSLTYKRNTLVKFKYYEDTVFN
ncbi:MAG: hypothetical protein J6I47_05975 [Ruminococcus sp.]|nr:DUF2500 family protein [Ruminococcus flavefaciens]MBP3746993.1 hypothetical protein [Ruminococcus sp.]MBQ1339647.1 hypothetical protein [Ruminococcus sp.]